MKLLLHTCCAPCLIYPVERLKEKGFEVKGFFYNPNIHPFSEYKNRKQAIVDTFGGVLLWQAQGTSPKDTERSRSEAPPFRAGTTDAALSINPEQTSGFSPKFVEWIDFTKSDSLEIIYPDYNPADYFRAINFKENKPERCSLCWELRLKNTAQFAKEKGFNYFSTTLLVSPYQDQKILKDIGDRISKEIGVEFYYEDFRPGFRQAHNKARREGIYCQKYCGCIYSERERYDSKYKSELINPNIEYRNPKQFSNDQNPNDQNKKKNKF